MSKRNLLNHQKSTKPSRRRARGKAGVILCLLVSMGLAGGILAQWRAARINRTRAMLGPAPMLPLRGNPSKEYIYAGGRLLTTEEPPGGTITSGNDTVWVEDNVPAGGIANGTNEGWTWTTANPAPFSSSSAHQSINSSGLHNHFFTSATETLEVNAGDSLFAYVYLDAASPPTELMLQWHDGSIWHNAYWGADNLNWVGTRYRVGDVPAAVDGTEKPGSANYTFNVPIMNLPGRGLDVSLALVYNSRLWNKRKTGSITTLNYDVDQSWPTPGFTLGYGKLLWSSGLRADRRQRHTPCHEANERNRTR